MLFSLVGINIFTSMFALDWLYRGLENYKFITIRNIALKLLSISLLFILVKSKGDYILYAGLGVLAVSGANIMPATLEAVKAYASVGEMAGVLREVVGEFKEPVIF